MSMLKSASVFVAYARQILSQGGVANIARAFVHPTAQDLCNGEGWEIGATLPAHASMPLQDPGNRFVKDDDSDGMSLAQTHKQTHTHGISTAPAPSRSQNAVYSALRGLTGCGGRGQADATPGDSGAGRWETERQKARERRRESQGVGRGTGQTQGRMV